MLGRSAEARRLCNRLLGHGGRLLTLLGSPGIGKTRLALAMAAHLQDHYAEGALFVPLAAVDQAAVMASTLLDALGRNVSGAAGLRKTPGRRVSQGGAPHLGMPGDASARGSARL